MRSTDLAIVDCLRWRMKLRYKNTADRKSSPRPRRRLGVFVCAIGFVAPILWSASSDDNKDEPIGAVDAIYDGTLTPDVQVSSFRHIDRVFPSRTVSREASVYPLPASPTPLKNF